MNEHEDRPQGQPSQAPPQQAAPSESPRSPMQPGHDYGPADEISLIELINVVLKNRRLVVLTPFVVFVLVVGYTFLQPRTYTSSASFVPQTSSGQRSVAAGLAAQFGVSIPGGEAGQSPQFYADLIESRVTLGPISEKAYAFEGEVGTVSGPVSELLQIEEDSAARTREETIRALQEMISVSTDRETGLISFSVQTEWPELSRLLAADVIDLLNRFNLETRQSQASTERRFVEERMAVMKDSLRAAEDALESFLNRNRQIEGNAVLQFERDRLQREVNSNQQVYTSLNQAHEQARIDEVRDTPVLTVVERPEAPVLPDRRRLLLKGILALMVGGMLGIFGAFGREFMIRGRQQEADEFAEFEQLKRETFQDLKKPWRFLKG